MEERVTRGHHPPEVSHHGQKVDIITQLVIMSPGRNTVRQHSNRRGDHSRRLRVHTGNQPTNGRGHFTIIPGMPRIDRTLGNQTVEI